MKMGRSSQSAQSLAFFHIVFLDVPVACATFSNIPQIAFVDGLTDDSSHQISIGICWHQCSKQIGHILVQAPLLHDICIGFAGKALWIAQMGLLHPKGEGLKFFWIIASACGFASLTMVFHYNCPNWQPLPIGKSEKVFSTQTNWTKCISSSHHILDQDKAS